MGPALPLAAARHTALPRQPGPPWAGGRVVVPQMAPGHARPAAAQCGEGSGGYLRLTSRRQRRRRRRRQWRQAAARPPVFTSCSCACCLARLPSRASASEAAALDCPAPSEQPSAPVTRSRRPLMLASGTVGRRLGGPGAESGTGQARWEADEAAHSAIDLQSTCQGWRDTVLASRTRLRCPVGSRLSAAGMSTAPDLCVHNFNTTRPIRGLAERQQRLREAHPLARAPAALECKGQLARRYPRGCRAPWLFTALWIGAQCCSSPWPRLLARRSAPRSRYWPCTAASRLLQAPTTTAERWWSLTAVSGGGGSVGCPWGVRHWAALPAPLLPAPLLPGCTLRHGAGDGHKTCTPLSLSWPTSRCRSPCTRRRQGSGAQAVRVRARDGAALGPVVRQAGLVHLLVRAPGPVGGGRRLRAAVARHLLPPLPARRAAARPQRPHPGRPG